MEPVEHSAQPQWLQQLIGIGAQQLLQVDLVGRLRQTKLDSRAVYARAIQPVDAVDGLLSFFKVNKRKVLDLFDSVNGALCGRFLKLALDCVLSGGQHQISHIDHFDRGHHVLVHLRFGLGPVDRNRLAEYLHPIGNELASGDGSRPMTRILHKSKAPVLGLVMSTWIHDHIEHVIGHFSHLVQYFLAFLVLGYAAHKQSAIVHTAAHTDHLCLSDLKVVQLVDTFACVLPARVHDKAVAAVEARVLHHETELVEGPDALEYGHQLVLEAVARYLADEGLAAPVRHWPSGPVRRRSVPALPVLLAQRVAGAADERVYGLDVRMRVVLDELKARLLWLIIRCHSK
ncbi:hypothetical protein BpHYR1_018774 [Brachionus plicatilis]|uniref:Uncharacterized protein n=1 Tax=Brachionus plicatilis TaxID=10195 RepID=A0A3M7QZ04_BRAPC|nr:hypothetical protein BpHYR1_018774 [Brachionus plicatilis]